MSYINCITTFNILTAGTHLPGLEEGTEKELNAVMLKMVAALTVGSVRNTGKKWHDCITLMIFGDRRPRCCLKSTNKFSDFCVLVRSGGQKLEVRV